VSDERISLVLWNWPQAWQALRDVAGWVKARVIAGQRIVLELRQETRSDAQNRLLHSRLRDVSKHCEWAGAKRDEFTWKRLFMSAWLRTQGEHVEVLPALDGHGVDIVYASTTKLSRRECVDLSDYVFAWGSEREVPWCLASLGRELAQLERQSAERIDPETGEILEAA
jgi:hypothetical protein